MNTSKRFCRGMGKRNGIRGERGGVPGGCCLCETGAKKVTNSYPQQAGARSRQNPWIEPGWKWGVLRKALRGRKRAAGGEELSIVPRAMMKTSGRTGRKGRTGEKSLIKVLGARFGRARRESHIFPSWKKG